MSDNKYPPEQDTTPAPQIRVSDGACQATSREELLRQLLDSRIPKNEREWFAAREIRTLQEDENRLNWLQNMSAYVKFEAEDDSSLPVACVMIPDLKEGWKRIGEGEDYREAIDDAISKFLHSS